MHLPEVHAPDSPAQRGRDLARWRRAFNASLAAVLLLAVAFAAQGAFDAAAWTVRPGRLDGLVGLLTAPLLHGSVAHLASNGFALLVLGTVAGAQVPRALAGTLPLAWLGGGLAAWALGTPGSHHLGASGVASGLVFMLLTLGLLRRDRPSVAAAMLALVLFGGALLGVLPREPGVSWQSHLGGAVAGVLAAWLLRAADPQPPRVRYSWEDEVDEDDTPAIEPVRVEAVRIAPARRGDGG
ncbi:rhomboid family intramembrane serine protease [Lysobacter sp. N42]|jgi:membrane associated rhomboid family serine protease|uniref:rhomboid family intramembrane serine protease n=1 Tax=Lysobacter sp. N42 TaxID=2545719 RepID=UPI0010500DB6|nr:rhomboid family intramembrane serine protease [Lysobacter sp. N42]